MWKVVDIAMMCVVDAAAQRPTMAAVIMQLKESLALEEAREKEYMLYKLRSYHPKRYPSRFPRFLGTIHPTPINQTHWKAWKLEFLPSQANPVGVQKAAERLRYKSDVALNVNLNTASPAFTIAMDNTTAGIRPDPTPFTSALDLS
ncbi:hypothetical protein HU200_063973 [Digitaria exilis]|uniref:Uncharacterized protein n=1 Tax=Digitaria exilis TaxID=1010633 RepID=A0A835AAG2_9POAL|nr:hypothetical protein HU200_063973 [Digitaria exilis]